MRFLTPVWHHIDALVHPAARTDALTAARHRAFIAPRLLGSLAALAGFPVYLALRGAPGALEVGVFAWLVAPILIAFFLSRTARYQTAHALSALALTGLVTIVAWHTGGILSFAAVWLVVVPLEAALSAASRRVVALASLLALAAAGLLTASTDGSAVMTALGIVTATLYATGFALAAQHLARMSHGLLYAEQDRYHLLACNVTEVMTRHGRHGAVQFVSPAAEQLFGVAASALTGHGLFERVHIADRPAYLTALADAAAKGEDRAIEFRIRRGDGKGPGGHFAWVEMRCRPLTPVQEVQEVREVVAVLRDIHDRKTQERALEIARAESKRANAAKSRFLATMSHELRTPLNAIIGFSEMLGNESLMLEGPRKLEYARLINNSGQHLLSVVNAILDMSRMEMGNFEITPEPFAAAPAIASCCELLALKAQEAGVELKTHISRSLPEFAADRRAFNQILINLVANAIKFTPRAGKVTVDAYRDGAMLVVTVEDTGVGIGEDDLPHLGEAFFQARSSYDRHHDGTGLGLSIVKSLVHLHNGDIGIKSKLGEGTRVTVRLPFKANSRGSVDPLKPATERADDTTSTKVRKVA